MSVAAIGDEVVLRRAPRRRESEVASEVAMALLAAGLVSVPDLRGRRSGTAAPSDAVLGRIAEVVGVPVEGLRGAWERNSRHGYRPPTAAPSHAEAPTAESQRPSNRKRFEAKNPAAGKRVCSDCKLEKNVTAYNVKNGATGNRFPWCIPCGEKRGRRNYVSAAEAGIVTLARAALAAGSPFIGQPCPHCGAALEVGEEVEGCDVTLRHVCCPATRAIKAVGDRDEVVAAAPVMAAAAAREFVAPVLGWDSTTGREVRWPAVGPDALANSHIAIWGSSGSGKTAFVLALLAQLARWSGTCFGVTDFKDDYLPLAGDAELVDLWRDGLVYNPFALDDDSPRAVDGAVIEIRDAVTAAARSCSVRMGHRQLDRLRTALTEIYCTCRAQGRWPTMLDLDAALGDDLSAAIGDLTRNEIFRDGPPLGRAIERSLVFGLAGIPGGSGMTQTLATGFIVSSLMLRIHAAPTQPNTLAYALAIDEAHRVAGFKAVDTLIREGRSKGLAMIVATQQPDDMPAVVAANAATRICFGQPDAATAAVAAKRLDPTDATLAARIRRLGTGRAVVRLGPGRLGVVDMVQFHRDGGRLGDNGNVSRPESMPAAPSAAPSGAPVKRDPVRPARRDQAAMVPSGRRSRDPDDEDDEGWERRLRRAAW